ncbi:MAG: translation initiation factor IF-6 [Aigarchaeota archaeon]|nr:translation initiation factor IF-6 [Aigarchaeota archaeon]
MKAGKQSVVSGGIYTEEFFGTVEVGLFATTTDEICIVPPQTKPRHERLIEKALGVEVIRTTIAGSFLIGPLVVGNSSGLVISRMVLEEELEKIRSSFRDLNTLVLESKYTAVGNLILVNDRAALVSSYFNKREVEMIQDVLGVEVLQGVVANRPYVGSISVVTNNGGVLHVQASQEEEKNLSEFFKVEFLAGTVNDGVPFIRSGVIANSRGAIVGARTTGPELMILSRALKV